MAACLMPPGLLCTGSTPPPIRQPSPTWVSHMDHATSSNTNANYNTSATRRHLSQFHNRSILSLLLASFSPLDQWGNGTEGVQGSCMTSAADQFDILHYDTLICIAHISREWVECGQCISWLQRSRGGWGSGERLAPLHLPGWFSRL